jgi:hypothetical protein
MTAIRVVAILSVLGTPAVFAPPLVRARGRIPRMPWGLLAVVICLIPLTAPLWLIGTQRPRLTMLIAILGGIVMLKAVDWLAAPRCESDLVRVWLALTFWPALEIEDVGVLIPGMRRRISLLWRRLAAGVPCLVVGLAMAATGQLLGLPDRDIWVDSVFKCAEIYLLANGSNHLLVAAFAAAGFRGTDAFRYPILAHSVLDFWSRYNVWIHRWLKKHIFEPIGRRGRRPVTGILAVFATSGLLHDYLMVLVAPDLLGWQFTFFGLHGVGAIVGTWLGRKYRAIRGRNVPRSLAIAATLGFVLATAPIFIHCMDRVVDLHRDLGGWVLTMVEQDRWRSDTAPPAPRIAQTHRAEPCKRALTSSQGEPTLGLSRWASRRRCKSWRWASESVIPSGEAAILSQSSSTRTIRSATLS